MTARDIPIDSVEAVLKAFEEAKLRELLIKFEGFELHLSDRGAEQPTRIEVADKATTPSAASRRESEVSHGAAAADVLDDSDDGVVVRAPYMGTFYRAPKPGEPPYVEIGSQVSADTPICLLEVMKLFTAISAGAVGTISRILAADGSMVTENQPLFVIAKAG